MIKFTHIADIHLGVEAYGKIDPKTGVNSRLLDFNRLLNLCIEQSIRDRDDFFLIAGDVYKTSYPTPTQQRFLLQSLLRLKESGIPVVMVIGNHDNPLSFGKVNALGVFEDIPFSEFHVFSKPGILNLETKNGPIQIMGMPWFTKNSTILKNSNIHKNSCEITKYISNGAADIIRYYAGKLDKNIPAILVGHLTISSGIFSGSEKRAIYGGDPVLLPSQIAIKPFDYIALGHLHKHQNLNPNGYPAIVYSGSLECMDFGERKDKKGFCKVYIEKPGKTTFQFIEIPARKFIQIEVEIKKDIEQTKQIIQEIRKYDIKEAILKIIYYLPPNVANTVNLSVIENICLDAYFFVGIFPVKKYQDRNIRGAIKSGMDFPTILKKYFDLKPEYNNKKQALIKKILELESEFLNIE